MSTVFEQVTDANMSKWECKQCHDRINDDQTVAYHLVDRVLYGWCEPCFARRG